MADLTVSNDIDTFMQSADKAAAITALGATTTGRAAITAADPAALRSVVERNELVIVTQSVYGATGDGVTDDRAAIQSAIDAAPVGGTIYIPAGTYLVGESGANNYALNIDHSLNLILDPGATIRLSTAAAGDVAVIRVGDGSSAISGISISGGTIDGNAVANVAANASTYSTGGGAISITGPVSDVRLRDILLTNMLGVGLSVSGQSSAVRAKRIAVENVSVTECGEGVRFEKCDDFHMRGGRIVGMHSQDCFEPHGALNNWSLRDCYIAEPDPSNSAIEIFPQHGDIVGGLVENCVIEGDELRVSLSSGATTGDHTVYDVTVRKNYFKNSHAYLGVNGKYQNLTFDGNVFEGPSAVARSVPSDKSGIQTFWAENSIRILNNTVYNYDARGIFTAEKNALIQGNVVYNNGQDTTATGSVRYGIDGTGSGSRIVGNHVYDDQATATQTANLAWNGDGCVVMGNVLAGTDAVNLGGRTTTNSYVIGNSGLEDHVRLLVMVAAGTSGLTTNRDDFWGGLAPGTGDVSSVIALGDMSPATRYWITRPGGQIRLNLDANVTADTYFVLIFNRWPETISQP